MSFVCKFDSTTIYKFAELRWSVVEKMNIFTECSKKRPKISEAARIEEDIECQMNSQIATGPDGPFCQTENIRILLFSQIYAMP